MSDTQEIESSLKNSVHTHPSGQEGVELEGSTDTVRPF